MTTTQNWFIWALLSAIFAVIFLRERQSARDWIGILLVAAGVIVLGLKK